MTEILSCKGSPDIFTKTPPFSWRDVGPREHFVQFYETDDFLAECVAEYLGRGLAANEKALVIATPAHQKAIADKLQKRGIDLTAAIQRRQFFQCDAEETLSSFMVDGMPDDDRFNHVMGMLLGRLDPHGKGLRIFGEMVALLWAAHNMRASIRLEELWNSLAMRYNFSLFCGYPAKGPARTADNEAILHICKEHSRVLPSKPGGEDLAMAAEA